MKSCIEYSLHPVGAAIFFASLARHSDVGFGFFRGHFGAARVNQRFSWVRGALLGIACGGQANVGGPRKFTGAEMLGLYGLARPEPALVNSGVTRIDAPCKPMMQNENSERVFCSCILRTPSC